MEKQLTGREQAAISRIARQLGRRGGRAAAANMTPRQRQLRAKKAARARWSKEVAHA